MMLKQLFALAILSHSVFCRFTPNERELVEGADQGTGDNWKYCEDRCNKTCVTCEDHHVCKEEETKCGEGPVQVVDGLTLPNCARDERCVSDDCYCPSTGNDGELCDVICDANCNNETEIVCPGGQDPNDCTLQENCIAKGHGDNNIICPGFCPVECDEHHIICDQPTDSEGCKTAEDCQPKQKNNQGAYCDVQQCQKTCTHTEHLCAGDVGVDGCKELDICVPKQDPGTGELCPGTCPEQCQDGQIKCDGTIDYSPTVHYMCKGQDVCHIIAKNTNGEDCAEDSASHGCPVTCTPDEVLCPAKEGQLGCKEEEVCIPISKDDQGENCPQESDCPTLCEPYHVNCPGGVDDDGCKNPDLCIEEHRDFNGDVCPVHCPENCEDDEVYCPGTRSPINGCFSKDKCEQKENHVWGETPGAECPGWCPAICNDHEVLCPSMIDPCNGCPTEEICREAIKDVNGIFCPGKEYTIQHENEDYRENQNRRGGHLSASHNCPVYCKEWNGEVQCPVYEDALGCKPEALCAERTVKHVNEDGSKEYCPSSSVCPKECASNQHVCRYASIVDEDGCGIEDICVNIARNGNGQLCPTTYCPPHCSGAEELKNDGNDLLDCPTASYCV